MNTTKITITLTLDEKMGDDADMLEAISLLRDLGQIPCTKVVLSLECAPVAAEGVQDRIDSALADCPDPVDVTIKTTHERGIRRLAKTTPIERALQDSGARVAFLRGRGEG